MDSKKIGWIILAIIVITAITVLVKTVSYPFAKDNNRKAVPGAKPHLTDKSIARLAGGIRIPTVSNEDYSATHFAPFDSFKIYLQEVYPLIYNSLDTLTINNYGLVFHWKGKNSSLKPILFLSHYDVVPVTGYDPTSIQETDIIFNPDEPALPPIDSIQKQWQYPPFSGAVANGRIYGRGTLDMKGMLFSILEAADSLLEEGFQPEQDIWFAFGHDEEVGGRQGAIHIANYFKNKDLQFDAVYDEGGIIAAPRSAMESIDKPLALVGTGEKGLLTLRIKVYGLGGHSSMPPEKSSLVNAADIIERLNNNQMPARIIPPIASFLKETGGFMNFPSRAAIANQWLMESLLIRSLSSSPASNALVRTTTAISMAKGSDAPNVLASVAEITVNFRILQGDSVASVIDHVKKLCEGYETEIENMSAREPSGLSTEDTKGFQIIQETLPAYYPDANISSYITIGGTDAYKYQSVSNNIYRFMPVCLNQYEQRTIHNENEYISLENYKNMISYFKSIMQNY